MSRKTDYALVALARLARAAHEADHRDAATVSARQIAETYGLPTAMLMNVLKELHKAGIVTSERGAMGGYALARSPEDITVLDIIELIEGPVRVSMCCDDEEDGEPCAPCHLLEQSPITGPVRELNNRIVNLLGNVTLAELMRGEVAEVVSREASVMVAIAE